MICTKCREVIHGNYKEEPNGVLGTLYVCFTCTQKDIEDKLNEHGQDYPIYCDGYEDGYIKGKIDAFKDVIELLNIAEEDLKKYHPPQKLD